MGFDFTPRNKTAGDFFISAYVWPYMLDAGLGLVLGCGEGFEPGHFIYIVRPDDRCIRHNDGARVTARECKDLAKVARWIAAVQEARIKQWEEVPAEEQQRMRKDKFGIYKLPWHPGMVQQFRNFADWCEKAGGFRIT